MATLTKHTINVPGGDINAYTMACVAGDTFAPMDVVKFSSGQLVAAAADDTAAAGWAITAGVADQPCILLKGQQGVKVVMSYDGDAPAVGAAYALKGTTGAQAVDQADATNHLFAVHQVDSANELAEVSLDNGGLGLG